MVVTVVVIVVTARLGAMCIAPITGRLVSPVNAVTCSDMIHGHSRESHKSMHAGSMIPGSI